jgi:hypothetical protein
MLVPVLSPLLSLVLSLVVPLAVVLIGPRSVRPSSHEIKFLAGASRWCKYLPGDQGLLR